MRRLASFLVAGIVALSCASGCAHLPPSVPPVEGDASWLRVEEIASPAGPDTALPRWILGRYGSNKLSWVHAPQTGPASLRIGFPGADGLHFVHTLTSGDDWFVNWADFPSVLEIGRGEWVAHWLVESGPESYAYDIRMAWWERPGAAPQFEISPHRDGTLTEHGFVSLVAWPRFDVHLHWYVFAVWLDGRKFAGSESGHAHGEAGAPSEEMTLRCALIDRGGKRSEERELDGRVCDCCQTDAVWADGALVIAYRDRSPSEVRDISLIRWADGEWGDSVTPHPDGWELPGCPVNGPALDAREREVALAWFTVADGDARVRLAFSPDAGASFPHAFRVSDAPAEGRVDVALVDEGRVWVSWIDAESGAILVREFTPDGATGPPAVVVHSETARSSGFPRIIAEWDGGGAWLAYTETEPVSRVRVLRLTRKVESPG